MLYQRRLLHKQLKAVAEGRDPAGVSFDAAAPLVKLSAGNFLVSAAWALSARAIVASHHPHCINCEGQCGARQYEGLVHQRKRREKGEQHGKGCATDGGGERVFKTRSLVAEQSQNV